MVAMFGGSHHVNDGLRQWDNDPRFHKIWFDRYEGKD